MSHSNSKQNMTMAELALAIGGKLHGNGNLAVCRVSHPADITDDACLALAFDENLLPILKDSPAKAAVVGAKTDDKVLGFLESYIKVERPRLAMARITAIFERPAQIAKGVHPSAIVESGAVLGDGVRIGAMAYVAAGAKIGDNCAIHPQAYIGAEAKIGADSVIYSGVRIGARVHIGERCIAHFNASIGSDGFSFVTPEIGSVEAAKSGGGITATNTALIRIASLGTVEIGNDVEIGANTSIDRGTVSATRIGDGTKIDNQVQIAHNVVIGKGCLICGRTGIAGSAVIGDRVVLGGGTGVADHVSVGDDVVAMALSGIGNNIKPKTLVAGIPAIPREQAAENLLNVKRIKTLMRRLADLEARLSSDGSK